MYVLRKSREPDFFACTYNGSKFKTVFGSMTKARHVHYTMNPVKPNLRLSFDASVRNINIGSEIEEQLGLDLGRVYLHTPARLRIDKRSRAQRSYQRSLTQELLYHIDIETVEENKIAMEPFVRDIGILVPFEVIAENENNITLATHALFPESYLDASVDPVSKRVRRLDSLFYTNINNNI